MAKKVGRPSDYSREKATAICDQIEDGRSLRAICQTEGMPAKSTVLLWLALHPEFSAQYARAREAQADKYAEEILEIADDASRDYIETEDGPKLNSEHVQRSRLRVDSRKWLASKLAPKKYGEKLELAGDPDRPIVPTLNVSIRREK